MSKQNNEIIDDLFDEEQGLQITEAQRMCSDLLKYLTHDDIISLSHIRETKEEMQRKTILSSHPYTIWQGKDGNWRTYLPDEKKGRKLVKKSTRRKLENEIIEHSKEAQKDPTVADVFYDWIDRKRQLKQLSDGTYERYKCDFTRFYEKFGKRKIKSVTVNDFVDFLEEQVPKYSLTAKSFSNLKIITKGIISRASRLNLIDYTTSSVFDRIETSDADLKKKREDDSHEVFNVKETTTMMNYLTQNPDIWNLGLLLLFVTGMRVGELVALKWDDYSPDVISVKSTEIRYKDENGKYVYSVKDSPKTEAGIRSVVIPKAYQWIHDSLKELNPNSEYVFSRNGERMHATCFRDHLRRLCDKLDVVRKSPHKIRKTYCTILLDNNVDANFIKKQMGHSNISISENSYHRDRKDLDRKIEMVSELPEFQEPQKTEAS